MKVNYFHLKGRYFSFRGGEVLASGGGVKPSCDTWISRSQNAHKNCRKPSFIFGLMPHQRLRSNISQEVKAPHPLIIMMLPVDIKLSNPSSRLPQFLWPWEIKMPSEDEEDPGEACLHQCSAAFGRNCFERPSAHGSSGFWWETNHLKVL
jgi:hypothetical protein